MILRQFLHADPVAASYLFGCGGQSVGAVVDPVGDIEPYLKSAEMTGMRLRYVIDTHIHADHISSARELAKAAGAGYVLFADADVNFPFKAVSDGDVLKLGNVIIRVLHTPGHTPEHISLIRTELATSAEEGARILYRTAQTLKELPDYLEILPGAYSGSVCGRSLSGKPISTIGFEKRNNKALLIDNEDEFVQIMVADIPVPPAGAAAIRAANSGREVAAP